MADPTFTANNGVTSSIVQPSYTRRRHRFRGQRESEKFNLDAHQMYYEFNRLLTLLESLEESQNNALDTLYGQEDGLPTDIEVTWVPDTFDLQDIFFDIPSLVAQVEGLTRRANKMLDTET